MVLAFLVDNFSAKHCGYDIIKGQKNAFIRKSCLGKDRGLKILAVSISYRCKSFLQHGFLFAYEKI